MKKTKLWTCPPAVYARANGLPDALTLAQYNLARALDETYLDRGDARFDYKVLAEGWIKHTANDYSDLTPSERMNNLNVMLRIAMANLFETSPTTVSFSLGFIVGGPHQSFIDMARRFRV